MTTETKKPRRLMLNLKPARFKQLEDYRLRREKELGLSVPYCDIVDTALDKYLGHIPSNDRNRAGRPANS